MTEEADADPEPRPEMQKEVVEKGDGRYLLVYSWPGEPGEPGDD